MNIAFRADASDNIGTGHIMRCLTLAKILTQYDVSITFICRPIPEILTKRIESIGAQLLIICCENSDSLDDEIEPLQDVLVTNHYSWLIIDHYHSTIAYETHCKSFVQHIMVIDDLANRRHYCDILLDQSPDRKEQDYRGLTPDHCQLLLGQCYALIRDEFIQSQSYPNQAYRIKTVLITVGGTDPTGILPTLINTICVAEKLESYRFSIIVPNVLYKSLQNEGIEDSRQLSILKVSDTLANEMQQHDLIVSNCGVTLLERCALGKPGIGILLADNQLHNARAIEKNGAGLIIYPHDQLVEKLVNDIDYLSKHPRHCLHMMDRAKNLIDGQGKYRVSKRLLSYQH